MAEYPVPMGPGLVHNDPHLVHQLVGNPEMCMMHMQPVNLQMSTKRYIGKMMIRP